MTIHKTNPVDAAVHESGWVRVGDVEVTAVPLVDLTKMSNKGEHLFARLTYEDALKVAARLGARLVKMSEVEAVRDSGVQLKPYLGTPIAENTIEHSLRHDDDIWKQLVALGWDRKSPVCGAGKHWLHDAPPGKSRLGGWDKDGPGPSKAWWQPDSVAHNRMHHDDGTTTVLARAPHSGLGSRIASALSSAATWLVSGLRPTLPLVEDKKPVPIASKPVAFVAEFDCVTSVLPDGDGAPMPVVHWVVIHTAECGETSKSAENVAAFLVSRKDASAHFVIDNDSTVQQRSVSRQAGAAPGSNHAAIHIELAGYAKQTPAEWADAYSAAMLDRAATLVAKLCERFNLPVQFVDANGLKMGARGVTTHDAVSRAFKKSTHVDPGKSFPMEALLAAVRSKMGGESIYGA